MSQIEPNLQPTDITAAWLSNQLGTTIGHVSARAIGTGQVGATYRFDVGYAAQEATAPSSFIGKFMSDDPVSRATGIAQLSYVREVNFYRHYGQSAKLLPIPQVHFTQLNDETHEFALIMEDFPAHTGGNQLEPATLEEAQLAMAAAAQIHAAYWGNCELDSHSWLNGSRAIAPMNVDGLYTMLWPSFCDRYREQISEAVVLAGEAYLGRINDWIANRTGPRCLTHGDFRPDNMLFRKDDPNKPIIIVDWQTAGVGNGATDVSYYLGTALSPDMRRQDERALFDLWVEGLISSGVARHDTQGLWNVYRRDSFAGFLMGVLASMIVAPTARGDAMFLEMCHRSAAMIHDHRAYDLI